MIAHPYEQQNDAQGQEESRGSELGDLEQLPGREQHPKENQEHAEEGYAPSAARRIGFETPAIDSHRLGRLVRVVHGARVAAGATAR